MPDSEPLEPLNQESSSNTEQLKSSTTPNIPLVHKQDHRNNQQQQQQQQYLLIKTQLPRHH